MQVRSIMKNLSKSYEKGLKKNKYGRGFRKLDKYEEEYFIEENRKILQ